MAETINAPWKWARLRTSKWHRLVEPTTTPNPAVRLRSVCGVLVPPVDLAVTRPADEGDICTRCATSKR